MSKKAKTYENMFSNNPKSNSDSESDSESDEPIEFYDNGLDSDDQNEEDEYQEDQEDQVEEDEEDEDEEDEDEEAEDAEDDEEDEEDEEDEDEEDEEDEDEEDEDNNLISENITLRNKLLSRMPGSQQLIKIDGKIFGLDARFLIDTGAAGSAIFLSWLDDNKMINLIDKNKRKVVSGAFAQKTTFGLIHYLDLKINTGTQYIDTPITVDVIDNKYFTKNESGQVIKNISKHEFDVILGLDYLCGYKINIDFCEKKIIFKLDLESESKQVSIDFRT